MAEAEIDDVARAFLSAWEATYRANLVEAVAGESDAMTDDTPGTPGRPARVL
jgi:hypothetical protein